MSLSFKKIAGTALGAQFGGVPGAVVGNRVGNALEGSDDARRAEQKRKLLEDIEDQKIEARKAQIDPKLRQYGEQQMALSNQFRANQGNVSNDLSQQAANQGRVGLAQSLSDVRSNANSRGLLYSGLRQGQEAQAQGMASSQLQKQNYQNNLGLENQGRQLEGGALQAAGRTADAEEALAQNLAGLNAQETKEKGEAIQKLGSGLGMAAGAGIGAARR